MSRQLISEQNVIEVAKSGQKTLVVAADALVTSAARDKAASLGIKLISKAKSHSQESQKGSGKIPKDGETIAIGSDHGGFQLKQTLIPFVENLGYKVVDVGTYSEEPCDYPDFAYMVARMVSLGEATKGIMVDAVGIASAIVANKVPGVRAACCLSEFVATSSREHNDANILTLGGRILGTEIAKSIVQAWLETWFGGGRHKTRVEKIADIEKRHYK